MTDAMDDARKAIEEILDGTLYPSETPEPAWLQAAADAVLAKLAALGWGPKVEAEVPSDAEIDAALRAHWPDIELCPFPTNGDRMRAALTAAAQARKGGAP